MTSRRSWRTRALADRIVALIDLDDIFYMAAQIDWEQGRYLDAARHAEEGVARVTALGGDADGSVAVLAIARFLLGDWDAVVTAGRDVLDRHGPLPPGFLRILTAAAEYVHAARGDTEAVAVYRAIEMGTPTRLSFRALGLCADGRVEEALTIVQLPFRPAEGRSFQMTARAQVLHAAGQDEEAVRACAAIRERAVRIGWPAGPAAADRIEAEIALTAGDAVRAAELATASAAAFDTIGAEWEAAVSRVVTAEALLALGRAGDATAQLAAARTPLERAGALAELARLASLSGRVVSRPEDGERRGGDEHPGEAAVDEAGASGIAE